MRGVCMPTYLICTHIFSVHIYVWCIHMYVHILIISKIISFHQTLSSCWLNLHVPCNSEKPVPYLHLQAFLLAVHLGPQEMPRHTSLSASLSPGIVWVRKLVRRWLLLPELRLPGFEWWWAHSWPGGGAWSSCALGLDGGKLALVGNGMSQLA